MKNCIYNNLYSVISLHYNRHMLIGEILVKNNHLEHHLLENVLDLQRNTHQGKRIGELLLDNNIITKDSLITALAEQQSAPGINILETYIDPAAVDKLTYSVANKYSVLPFRIVETTRGSTLCVATCEPNNSGLLDGIASSCGYPVKPFYSLKDDIRTAILISYN